MPVRRNTDSQTYDGISDRVVPPTAWLGFRSCLKNIRGKDV
jgi:hypothetical protein